MSCPPIETGGLTIFCPSENVAISQHSCIMHATRVFHVLKSHIFIHYSLDYNVVVLISTKINYRNAGANNITQSRPRLKTSSCSYSLFLGFKSFSAKRASTTSSTASSTVDPSTLTYSNIGAQMSQSVKTNG